MSDMLDFRIGGKRGARVRVFVLKGLKFGVRFYL